MTLIFALARHCALAGSFHACVAPGLTGPASRALSFAELEQGLVFNSLWILYIKTKNVRCFFTRMSLTCLPRVLLRGVLCGFGGGAGPDGAVRALFTRIHGSGMCLQTLAGSLETPGLLGLLESVYFAFLETQALFQPLVQSKNLDNPSYQISWEDLGE